jgi:hypothetical protein
MPPKKKGAKKGAKGNIVKLYQLGFLRKIRRRWVSGIWKSACPRWISLTSNRK